MSNHQASEQMLGYLYQVRYALNLLLDNDNSKFQISIEKFDDVAFSEDGTPKQLIQLKHHVKQAGDLTDYSTDLWRTLKVWIDLISENKGLVNETSFIIITTASVPSDTAAAYLKSEGRKPEEAYNKLKTVCEKSTNKQHEIYYNAFLNLVEDVGKKLLKNIYIIDNACNIEDVEGKIRKHIRYNCIPKHEEQILERLEGWWYKKAIEALCSDVPVFVSQEQVRSLIVSISQEYAEDNLPIDVWDIDSSDESGLAADEKIFLEQLKLICLGNKRMNLAIRDYRRAFQQRANWVRNNLLYVNELDKYENRLIDEWEHCFASIEDDLSIYGDGVEDNIKVIKGKELYLEIESKDIRIRPRCQEAFVMRGTYHILANQLKVGWHVDFMEKLKKILAE